MKKPRDQIGPPATGLEPRVCDACGFQHAAKPTITIPEFADAARLSVATIHTYRSRGGILPRAIGRPGGNPRWSSCTVARYLHGALPAELLDPVRTRHGGGAA